MFTNSQIKDIANQEIKISDLTDLDLLEFCIIANQEYRNGSPITSDENYDFIFIHELSKRLPNHPFLTKEKSWTTIDGHKSNHAGGSEYLNVDDYVYDIDKGWIKVIKIITVDGEHLTYNFIDMEYGTIIADRIVTHNSGTAQAG